MIVSRRIRRAGEWDLGVMFVPLCIMSVGWLGHKLLIMHRPTMVKIGLIAYMSQLLLFCFSHVFSTIIHLGLKWFSHMFYTVGPLYLRFKWVSHMFYTVLYTRLKWFSDVFFTVLYLHLKCFSHGFSTIFYLRLKWVSRVFSTVLYLRLKCFKTSFFQFL